MDIRRIDTQTRVILLLGTNWASVDLNKTDMATHSVDLVVVFERSHWKVLEAAIIKMRMRKIHFINDKLKSGHKSHSNVKEVCNSQVWFEQH